VKTATALIAALAAAVGPTGGPSNAPVRSAAGFGGSEPVRITHVGHIEVDLEPSGETQLRRVACAGASIATTACFVRG
jgi:hypothetical protein